MSGLAGGRDIFLDPSYIAKIGITAANTSSQALDTDVTQSSQARGHTFGAVNWLERKAEKSPTRTIKPAKAQTMSEPTREEYDAKLEALESRTDAGFARMEAQLSKLPSGSEVRANVWGAAVAVIATVIGLFSLWAVGFDSGIQITSTTVEDAIGAKSTAEQNAQNIDNLNQKMDSLIEIIQGRVGQSDNAQEGSQAGQN